MLAVLLNHIKTINSRIKSYILASHKKLKGNKKASVDNLKLITAISSSNLKLLHQSQTDYFRYFNPIDLLA